MSSTFISQLGVRRSIYALSKQNFPLKHEQVVKIVEEVIAATPSSFNNQTNRAIVLFGDSHDKLWKDIAYNALKAVVPAEAFESTAQKINLFAGSYGTVLFFQDTSVIRDFEAKFPPYAANFAPWSEQSSGSAQISVWTALALENVGANLQHYNELIAEKVAAEFKAPADWKLTSQLVFGTKAGEPNPKQTLPGSETVKSA